MRIAIVAPEAVPFAKTGGLADVAGALPKALFRLGHEPILIMPLYRQVIEANHPLSEVGSFTMPIGKRTVTVTVRQGQIPGTECPVYFLDEGDSFDREGIYGTNGSSYPDNCERFALLSRGALEVCRILRFSPDIFHVHDWQTALVPAYLKTLYADDPVVGQAASLLTIHNMAYQGVFWHWDMEVIGIGWEHFHPSKFEYWNKINLLKGGIVFSNVVNTVSPTYADEIQTAPFGHGLDGVLREKHAVVHGVVNGIDEAVWNPAGDPHIKKQYGIENLTDKAVCKRSLQRQVGLPQRKVPLAGIVTRFAEQKGLDIAIASMRNLFASTDIQWVVLGDGDMNLREDVEALADDYPDRVKAQFNYDEDLAHRIIAGSDMILVPSRFEPCGLTQLYALKYGSIPIVRRTGGLNDTVRDCTLETLEAGTATGFVFEKPKQADLTDAINRALELYRDPTAWNQLVRIGMAQDWSWEVSAKRYLELYEEARDIRKGIL
jgi:starch synthase